MTVTETLPPSDASPVRPEPDVRRQAHIEGYFGSTGTGKSTSVKRRLQVLIADRVGVPIVVFDPKHEYPKGSGASESEFLACVDHMGEGEHAPALWAVLQPSHDQAMRVRQFDRFCKVALSIAQACGGVVVVVDELHLVSDSSNAPAAWLELINTGRAYGVHILACSIRPQSIDMDFRSNLSFVRTGRLGEQADCQRMASKLMCAWEDIASLPNLAYIERDMLTGAPAERGVLTF